MELDNDRIDDAVLALLRLGLHHPDRVWKSLDWEAINHLCEKGYISAPMSKEKSVALTEEGDRRSLELLKKFFGAQPAWPDTGDNYDRVGARRNSSTSACPVRSATSPCVRTMPQACSTRRYWNRRWGAQ